MTAAVKLKTLTPWKEHYDQPAAAAAAKSLQSCLTLRGPRTAAYQAPPSIGFLDSILKSRDITLPTKVPLVKAMVFPVVMDVRVGL